jgi:ubiquitin-conjugating enzyme E2 R
MAQQVLLKQFKELSVNPVPGFTVNLKDDDIFEWEVERLPI